MTVHSRVVGRISARREHVQAPSIRNVATRLDWCCKGAREGLLYHENYARYLSELGIEVKFRQLARLENGIGDEVFTSDGRTLYFLNDKLKV